MEKEIILCGTEYRYELQRKKVKNLNLHIEPDGRIYVSAPRWLALNRIESFLKSKEEQLCALVEKQKRQQSFTPMPKNFRSGEEFCYLGRIRQLKLIKGNKNEAKLSEDSLYLCLRDLDNTESARRLFESFLKKETERLLTGICREFYPHFCPPLEEFPEIRFRKMRSRWGSCTPQKKLLCFNSCLCCLPPDCMEYVAAHEFTHFIYADHSKNFYTELSRFMPDRREREIKLRSYVQIPKQFSD